MSLRSLPPFPDLGAFLAHLDAGGQVRSIGAPVAVHLEAAEIHRRVIAQGGPVLVLRQPMIGAAPSALPVVLNLLGTRARVAAGLGLAEADLARLGKLMAWLRMPDAPGSLREVMDLLPMVRAVLSSRPRIVHRKDLWEAGGDLTALPVQTCWPGDAGPLITWPIVITRPPGPDRPSTYNLGVYRMQVLDGRRAIIRWLPMRGAAAHHRLWQADGQDMPVAVVIGADPATLLGAVMPVPEGVSELAVAGIVAGKRASLAPCESIPLHIPASAEIILEGAVSASQTAVEGPFGDHTGYYNAPEPFPVFTLKRLRVRRNGLYLSTFTGRAPDEPSVIADALLDVFKPLIRQQIPELVDLWLPPEACSYRLAVLAIRKRYPGQARRVMKAFWSALPQFSMTKQIIVVDEDIDLRSWSDVMWAVATRADPARDVMLLDRCPVDSLDFSSPAPGLGGKLGIDATRKIGTESARDWPAILLPDRAVAEQVSRRWGVLFPEGGTP